jgi:hypothetical protein
MQRLLRSPKRHSRLEREAGVTGNTELADIDYTVGSLEDSRPDDLRRGLAGVIRDGMRFEVDLAEQESLAGDGLAVTVRIADDVYAGVLIKLTEAQYLDFEFSQASRETMQRVARELRGIATEALRAAASLEERAPRNYSEADQERERPEQGQA